MPLLPDHYPISNVSRETFDKVNSCIKEYSDSYSTLIERWLWWNRSVNLFSRNTTAKQLELHIAHSLLLLFETRSVDHDSIIDAGTGGGLPGLPMAIAESAMPYFLVDKVSKKHLALKNIIHTLSIRNAFPLCEDISAMKPAEKARIVSKHAFHIPDLLNYLQNCNWSELSLLKGGDVFEELNLEILREFDIHIRRIEHTSSFFHNKFIVSILKKNSGRDTYEQ